MTAPAAPPPPLPPPPGPPGPSGPGSDAVEHRKPVTMRRLALAGFRAKPARFVATMLAVIVATAFLSGALVLRDSLGTALVDGTSALLADVDVAVLAPAPTDLGTQGGGPGPQDETVPAALVSSVAGVDGVAAAAGQRSAGLSLLGAGGKDRTTITGRAWVPSPDLNPFTVVAGRAPVASGEVVIDQQAGDDLGIGPGSTIQVATTTGQKSATVTGLVRLGDRSAADAGGDLLVVDADVPAWLGGGRPGYDAIWVAAADGVTPTDLAGRVRQVVPAGDRVLTGDQYREQEGGPAASISAGIGTGLSAFAYLALFVACFIIYNTFAVIVSQRTREFALLRAIGASRRQVAKSVRGEAFLVGLVASFLGYVVGALLVQALLRWVPSLRQLAGGGSIALGVSFWTLLQVLISGIIVTYLSAAAPSWRAGRSRPLDALRAGAVDRSGSSRGRAIAGVVLIVLGVVMLLVGSIVSVVWLAVLALPVLFLGSLVGGPVLAALFGRLSAFVLSPFRSTSLRLGVDNVRRNPRRAATTVNALVIGVFLVVFTTAAGGALRDYTVNLIGQFGGPDLMVAADEPGLPQGVAQQVASVPGVQAVAPVYSSVGITDLGQIQQMSVGAIDFRQASVAGVEAKQGSLAELGPDEVAVADVMAGAAGGLTIGAPLTVTLANGQQRKVTIGALVGFSLTLPPVAMQASTALEADPTLRPVLLAVQVDPGQATETQGRLEALTDQYSNLAVVPGNFIASFLRGLFDVIIASVNGLLAVAVLIAAFGIVNTLVLSVIERTREIGLLRAVGMSRRQVRSMVRIEAVLVSLLGALVGIVFGLFVAWTVTRPLFEDGGSFSWPVREMLLVIAASLVLGLLAALVPAHRAARADVLASISEE